MICLSPRVFQIYKWLWYAVDELVLVGRYACGIGMRVGMDVDLGSRWEGCVGRSGFPEWSGKVV